MDIYSNLFHLTNSVNMYDTVNVWLGTETAGNLNFLAVIPRYLENVTTNDRNGTTWAVGYLANYIVSVSRTGVSFKGSLPKYFIENNLGTLSRGDSQRAFEKLSDEVHLPLLKSKVSRFDIAQNFVMDYSPSDYYPFLGQSIHYNRLIQPNSLYYSNQIRTKLFYNKLIEAKRKGVNIPDDFNDSHLLRFELRFTSRIQKQLNVTNVTPELLVDEKFYITLIRIWIQEYMIIEKLNKPILKLWEMSNPTPNDFFNQILINYFQKVGQDEALRMVEFLRSNNTFDKPEYYSRIKTRIKVLCNSPALTEPSELVQELTKKVKMVENYCR